MPDHKKRKKNRLRKLRVESVDLVDRGAQGPNARVALFKRDAGSDTNVDDTSTSTPGTVKSQEHEKEMSVGKLSEEVLKSLPDEARQLIEDLTEEVETLETERDELKEQADSSAQPEGEEEGEEEPTLAKRDDLPEDVRKYLESKDAEYEAVNKRLEEAEKIAKQERDTRLEREWTDRIAKFDAIGVDAEKIGKQFKTLADKDDELAEELVETLKALNEQSKTASLFEEVGKRSPTEDSADFRSR